MKTVTLYEHIKFHRSTQVVRGALQELKLSKIKGTSTDIVHVIVKLRMIIWSHDLLNVALITWEKNKAARCDK